MGWAQASELREAIKGLRRAGKQVWAWVPSGRTKTYSVAAAADRVFTAPAGGVLLTGLGSELVFLGDLLGKLGVQVFVPRPQAKDAFLAHRLHGSLSGVYVCLRCGAKGAGRRHAGPAALPFAQQKRTQLLIPCGGPGAIDHCRPVYRHRPSSLASRVVTASIRDPSVPRTTTLAPKTPLIWNG